MNSRKKKVDIKIRGKVLNLEVKPLTIQIPTQLHTDLKILATSKGLKMKELCIEEFMQIIEREKGINYEFKEEQSE